MSVASFFSKKIISDFNKISYDFNKCKQFSLDHKKDHKKDYEITLIYIYLHLCKLTDNLDIKYFYSREANKIYLKHFLHKRCMLNEYDWTELELYNYNLLELFNYDVYYLSDSVKITNGRCIFKPNDYLFYRYKVEKHIGKGTFSNVYKCFDFKRSEHIAIKAIRNDLKFINSGTKEISALQKLRHNSICNFIKYFKYENHCFIVFELLEGNLYQYMKSTRFSPLKPTMVNKVAKQLIPVLVYIKSIDVIHADIKPENILIKYIDDDDIIVKLSDFGSVMEKDTNFMGYIVSRYYRAPEIILEQRGCCDYPIDMWSFSTIIYELLTGIPLFSAKTDTEIVYYIFKELGIPNESFLKSCINRKKLESNHLYKKDISNNYVLLHKNLSNIKDIDIEAFIFLIDTLCWNKNERVSCDEAMNHRYLLN
tara:strand:+ start:743 stop:2014 length:1272 start_codon:yes stop_codon:yes gene_type:complete